jgi:S-methylmethionine-dependent homocysteine/selenocysteine methylase
MTGNEVAGITWHTPDVEPLTQSEVDAEMVRLESVAATAEANRLATITAARDHAASLGFTDAMLAVMYPNLAP